MTNPASIAGGRKLDGLLGPRARGVDERLLDTTVESLGENLQKDLENTRRQQEQGMLRLQGGMVALERRQAEALQELRAEQRSALQEHTEDLVEQWGATVKLEEKVKRLSEQMLGGPEQAQGLRAGLGVGLQGAWSMTRSPKKASQQELLNVQLGLTSYLAELEDQRKQDLHQLRVDMTQLIAEAMRYTQGCAQDLERDRVHAHETITETIQEVSLRLDAACGRLKTLEAHKTSSV